MLKRILALACGALMVVGLASCKKEKELDVSKYVTLGQYKGIEVEMDTVVTDAEFEAVLKADLATYGEEVTADRPAQLGDTVNIDYVGKLDGVAFENGSDEDFDLVLGSRSFIDGFEDGLVGTVKGQVIDLNLNFPDPYPNNAELAGKAVVFTVTVNEVLETVVPELTLEFVQENTDYESIEDYKAALRTAAEAKALTDAQNNKYTAVWEKVIANATFADKYPKDIYDDYKAEVTEYYEEYASYYGMSVEDFLKAYGMTAADVEKEAVEYAQRMTKQELVLLAIIKAENFTLSQEEYDKGVQGYMAQYTQYEDVASFEEAFGKDLIKESLLWDKTLEYVVNQAVEIPVE